MVLPAPHFSPVHTLEAVARERCTALHGVPTMFIAELDHPQFREFDLSSLRTGIMAGAPCPIEVMKRVMREMHMAEITIACGMTETSPVCNMTEVDDPIEVRVGTVGKVMPHQEQKIIDPATGRILPRGEPGELCYRGYQVMRGYYNNPKARSQTIDDAGWLHGGDIAVMDEQRVRADHRPAQGHDLPRRREDLPARSRGVPLHPPEDRRGLRHRRAR